MKAGDYVKVLNNVAKWYCEHEIIAEAEYGKKK